MIILKPLLNLSAFVDGVIDLGSGLLHGRRRSLQESSILALATGARTREQVKLEVFEVL
jgi:hypothetical protein